MKKLILTLLFKMMIPVLLFSQNTDWFQKGLDATNPKDQFEYFSKCIEQGSDLFEAYFCRASVRIALGDVQGAIDDYTKCIELDSTDTGSYFNRGVAKQCISVDYQGAVADIAIAFDNSSPNKSTIVFFDNMFRKNDDCQGVIVFYNKIVSRFPANDRTLCKLGYCYMETGEDSLAIEFFSKSISLKPEITDAYLGMTLLFYYKNDLVGAKKYRDQAIAINPNLQKDFSRSEDYNIKGFICSERDKEALKTIFAE